MVGDKQVEKTPRMTDMGLVKSIRAGGILGGRYSRHPVGHSIESILRNVRGARRLARARQRVEDWLKVRDPTNRLTISELAVIVKLLDQPTGAAGYASIDLELDARGLIRQIGIVTTVAGTRLSAEGDLHDIEVMSVISAKRTLVAHNGADHDFPLLRSSGLTITRCTDSLRWSWIAWPLLPSHALGSLVEAQNVDVDVSKLHDAVADAEALAAIWGRVRAEVSGLDAATRASLRGCLAEVETDLVVEDLLGSEPAVEWAKPTDPWVVDGFAATRVAGVCHSISPDESASWPSGSVIATDDPIAIRKLAGECGLYARPSEIIDADKLLVEAQGWERAVGIRVIDVAQGHLALSPPSARKMLERYSRSGSGALSTPAERLVSSRIAIAVEIPNRPVVLIDGLASVFAPIPTGVEVAWPSRPDGDASALALDELGAGDRQSIVDSLTVQLAADPALNMRASAGEGILIRRGQLAEWYLESIDPSDYPYGVTIPLRGPVGTDRSRTLWKSLLGEDVEVLGPSFLGTSWTAIDGLDGAARSRVSGMAAGWLLACAASLGDGRSAVVVAGGAEIEAISTALPGVWKDHTGRHLLRPPRWPTVDEAARRLRSGAVAIAGLTAAQRLASNVDKVLVTQSPRPPSSNLTLRRVLDRVAAGTGDAFGEIIEPLGAHVAAELVCGATPAEVMIADPLRGTGYLTDLIGKPADVHIDEIPIDSLLRDKISLRLMDGTTRRAARHHLLTASVKRLVGEGQLRDFQQSIIVDCLAERDVIAVFRTGLGKSLCYQVPALVLGASGAVTVVVSPLIALQQDQLAGLQRRGVFEAVVYNSQMSAELRASVRRGIEAGFYTTVFLAPEALHGRAIAQLLSRLDLGLLVVDEAHCISEMGHDFRPDYRTLPTVIRRLLTIADDAPFPSPGNRPALMALTGTATPQVIDDIRERLS